MLLSPSRGSAPRYSRGFYPHGFYFYGFYSPWILFPWILFLVDFIPMDFVRILGAILGLLNPPQLCSWASKTSLWIHPNPWNSSGIEAGQGPGGNLGLFGNSEGVWGVFFGVWKFGVPKMTPNKTQGGNFPELNPRLSYGNFAVGSLPAPP